MADPTTSSPAAGPEGLVGRRLGDYQILRRLGQGAMAEVYLAEQLSLRRRVAIKVLKSQLAGDATYITRFQNEARAAAALVHANIVQIYEVGCLEGVHFIAQEYVAGVNLHELLVRRGPPEPMLALSIMWQVAAALAKAAGQGIVHRDIKPENIMLAGSGEVKVADFGLARTAQPHEAVNLTQVGITLGTPLYMSPEQVEGKPLDPRSDLYSFGVTCFHMLAGRPPFTGETPLAVAVQHLHKQPPALAELRGDLPAELCAIVERLMAKEPAQRFASARDVLAALRGVPGFASGTDGVPQASLELPLPAATPTTRLEATQRLAATMQTLAMQPRVRLRWRLWSAAAVAALLAGAVIAWSTREPDLLQGAASPPAIQRQATGREQFDLAMSVATIEAWQAVEHYFPTDAYHVRLARQELARQYLQQDDYDRALVLFHEFALEEDEELRAFGLAGQFVIETIRAQSSAARQTLAALWPVRGKLRDDLLRQSFNAAYRTIQKALDEQTSSQWQSWVEENLGEDAELPLLAP